MKRIKLILMLIAVSLLAASCLKSKIPTPLPYQKYINWYIVVNAQNDAALDPFYVSYKLNQYLYVTKVQFPGDVNKEDETRTKLFGSASVIQDGDIYKIIYSYDYSLRNEPQRNGTLVINTYGQLLSDPETMWTITTSDDNSYVTNHGYAMISQKISPDTYYIYCDEDRVWSITGSDIVQIDGWDYSTKWSVDYIMKQTKGSPTAIGQDRDLELTTGSAPTGGFPFNDGKTSGMSQFQYEILSPIYYSSACNPPYFKAGGIQRISLIDYTSTVKETATFDMGTQLICDPQTILTYYVDGVQKRVNLSTGEEL